jgi:hypothetical protein
MPDIEERFTTLPGSGQPPIDFAAANNGKNANVVK